MRYFIQFAVMASDIIFFGVIIFGVYYCGNINITSRLFLAFMVTAALKRWKKQGGFMAWQPKTIRQFLKNAR